MSLFAGRTSLGRPRRQEAKGFRVGTAVRESPVCLGNPLFVVGILFSLLLFVLPIGLAFFEPKAKLEQCESGPSSFPCSRGN